MNPSTEQTAIGDQCVIPVPFVSKVHEASQWTKNFTLCAGRRFFISLNQYRTLLLLLN